MRRIGEKTAGCGIATLVGVGGIVAYIVAPALVHMNWPEMDAPLVFVSLAAAIALFVGAGRTTRAYTVVFLYFGGIVVLLFSGSLATVHGWKQQAGILGAVAGLSLAIYLRWLVGGPARRLRRARALDKEEAAVYGETYLPLPVPMPGEATEIWASRAKVARTAALEMVFLAVVSGLAWGFMDHGQLTAEGVTMTVFCAMLAVLLLWGLGMTVRVLLRRRPAVVLMGEGFIDNATLMTGGAGYIRWRDVLGTEPFGKRAQRRLLVLVNDPGAVRERLSRVQRMQLAVAGMYWPSPVAIPQWLLPMRVEELQARMERRMEAAGATVFDGSDDASGTANREGGAHVYDFELHGGSGAFDVAVGGDRGDIVAGGDRGGGSAPGRTPATGEQPAG